MKRKKRFGLLCLLLSVLLLCGIAVAAVTEAQPKVADALSKFGSTGSEVKEIQKKLRDLGYYTAEIDGIYGSRTKAAVERFQRDKGLAVDGIAGAKTLKALGITSSSSSAGSYSQSDLNLLARVIYGEARGESYLGQVAVGAVILNRVKHPSFPNTVAGVVYQKGAFDAVADGQVNLTPDSTAYKAAEAALNGWDPTDGCIYYYNPATATNAWIRQLPITMRIGNHVFSPG